MKQLKKVIVAAMLAIMATGAYAQVGIGTATPNPSAQLEVNSSDKGFLPPRLTAGQRDQVTNPPAGLMIYCSDCGTNGQFNYYNGTAWVDMVGGTPATIIGSPYQGGKIAYVFKAGDPGYVPGEFHGLIAAASDQPFLLGGCNGLLIAGADGIAIGTGNQNTIDIMAACPTANIAARVCGDLVLNGYSDWYLPSIGELQILYNNRVAIGGFVSNFYWSSSERDANNFTFLAFNTGATLFGSKTNSNLVRPVRTF